MALWIQHLFPKNGVEEKEQWLAVLLENEFAAGSSALISAQFRSRIQRLANPATEPAARCSLISGVLTNLSEHCPAQNIPIAIMFLASAASEIMNERWTFAGESEHAFLGVHASTNTDGF